MPSDLIQKLNGLAPMLADEGKLASSLAVFEAVAEIEAWQEMYDKIPRHELGIPGAHFISVHNRMAMEWRAERDHLADEIVITTGENDRLARELFELKARVQRVVDYVVRHRCLPTASPPADH